MANESGTNVTTDVPLVTTAETVVATAPNRSFQNPTGQGVRISGVCNVTAGTSTTAVQVRVRRGGLTGTLIGEAQTHTLAATATANVAYCQVDTATLTGDDISYVVTLQQVAASANGTCNSASITTQPDTVAA